MVVAGLDVVCRIQMESKALKTHLVVLFLQCRRNLLAQFGVANNNSWIC